MRILAAFLVVIIGLTQTVSADTSGLRRLTDREDLLGWEAIGRLDLAGRGFCTGTLIATDLVLTAAHCAFDRRSGEPYLPEQITFRAGLRDGVAIAERTVLQVATLPEFQPSARPSPDRIRADVALMRLAQPISVAQADPFVLTQDGAQSGAVSLASYGMDREEAISRQRSCQVLDAGRGLMAFDCDVTFGSSGSAVLSQVGGRGRIVSVISAMVEIDGRKVALGMDLTQAVTRLKAQLRRDPVPLPDRRVKRVRVGEGRSAGGAKFIKVD
ncbi:MAG: trypsin-like serine protease [Rhodobacteraceae bacterium]|nr:trypsin-like serine protease [Paracoccaceae bacterium]